MKTSNKLSQIAFIITREFRAISTSYAVLLVLMGGIFVYGLLYNYMYAPNIVTKAPVAVVDNSHSSLSRQYIRWLSATPQVEIYAQAMDYHEAQEWMKQGKVQGILYLPHNFHPVLVMERKHDKSCSSLSHGEGWVDIVIRNVIDERNKIKPSPTIKLLFFFLMMLSVR